MISRSLIGCRSDFAVDQAADWHATEEGYWENSLNAERLRRCQKRRRRAFSFHSSYDRCDRRRVADPRVEPEDDEGWGSGGARFLESGGTIGTAAAGGRNAGGTGSRVKPGMTEGESEVRRVRSRPDSGAGN